MRYVYNDLCSLSGRTKIISRKFHQKRNNKEGKKEQYDYKSVINVDIYYKY